jgi:predicted  nucleic acid-binding Zn-ribbon protein
MWGSALADLAKKAREQADHMQLNEVTNNLSGAFSGFSLDSMLDNNNGEQEDNNTNGGGVGTTPAIPAAATNNGVNATTTSSSSYNSIEQPQLKVTPNTEGMVRHTHTQAVHDADEQQHNTNIKTSNPSSPSVSLSHQTFQESQPSASAASVDEDDFEDNMGFNDDPWGEDEDEDENADVDVYQNNDNDMVEHTNPQHQHQSKGINEDEHDGDNVPAAEEAHIEVSPATSPSKEEDTDTEIVLQYNSGDPASSDDIIDAISPSVSSPVRSDSAPALQQQATEDEEVIAEGSTVTVTAGNVAVDVDVDENDEGGEGDEDVWGDSDFDFGEEDNDVPQAPVQVPTPATVVQGDDAPGLEMAAAATTVLSAQEEDLPITAVADVNNDKAAGVSLPPFAETETVIPVMEPQPQPTLLVAAEPATTTNPLNVNVLPQEKDGANQEQGEDTLDTLIPKEELVDFSIGEDDNEDEDDDDDDDNNGNDKQVVNGIILGADAAGSMTLVADEDEKNQTPATTVPQMSEQEATLFEATTSSSSMPIADNNDVDEKMSEQHAEDEELRAVAVVDKKEGDGDGDGDQQSFNKLPPDNNDGDGDDGVFFEKDTDAAVPVSDDDDTGMVVTAQQENDDTEQEEEAGDSSSSSPVMVVASDSNSDNYHCAEDGAIFADDVIVPDADAVQAREDISIVLDDDDKEAHTLATNEDELVPHPEEMEAPPLHPAPLLPPPQQEQEEEEANDADNLLAPTATVAVAEEPLLAEDDNVTAITEEDVHVAAAAKLVKPDEEIETAAEEEEEQDVVVPSSNIISNTTGSQNKNAVAIQALLLRAALKKSTPTPTPLPTRIVSPEPAAKEETPSAASPTRASPELEPTSDAESSPSVMESKAVETEPNTAVPAPTPTSASTSTTDAAPTTTTSTTDLGGFFNSFFLQNAKPAVPIQPPAPAPPIVAQPSKIVAPPVPVAVTVPEVLKPTTGSVAPQFSSAKPEQQDQQPLTEDEERRRQDAREKKHESTIQRFVEQMQRLDEHHTAEKADLTKGFDSQINHLELKLETLRATAAAAAAELAQAQSNNTSKDSTTSSAEMTRLLEEQKQIHATELEQSQAEQRTLQQSLEDEKRQCEALASKHEAALVSKEDTIHTLRTSLTSSNNQVTALEARVKLTQQEAQASQEQYENLKGRVKAVATELKERRIECRTLSVQVEDLTSTNSSLKFEVDRMQVEVASKTAEAEQVQSVQHTHEHKVTDLEEQVSKLERDLGEERKRSDRAMSTYKAKSVKALGDSQRRVATANQSKAESEAELEVLRAHVEEMQDTMDAMSDRVEDRLKDSKDTIASLEKSLLEKDMLLGDMEADLSTAQEQAAQAVDKTQKLEQEMTQTRSEWEDIQCDYQKEVERNRELAKSNTQMDSDMKNLRSELNILREEYEDLQNELHSGGKSTMPRRRSRPLSVNLQAHSTSDYGDMADGQSVGTGSTSMNNHNNNNNNRYNNPQADGHDMVAILQEELQEANTAISGLKQALRQALSNNNNNGSGTATTGNKKGKKHGGGVSSRHEEDDDNSSVSSHDANADFAADLSSPSQSRGRGSYADVSLGMDADNNSNDNDNDAPPNALYFAFEKQAELNTAREEINRLANLVGEVQSEKTDALEKCAHLEKGLEETNAKMQRQSKLLGYAETSKQQRQQPQEQPMTPGGSRRYSGDPRTPGRGGSGTMDNSAEEAANAATANVEYLKHVMLRYLHAKSNNEKRGLLPVVSAVLCLTSDEKKSVDQAIQETGGLTGMGNAFFESLEVLSGKSNNNTGTASGHAANSSGGGGGGAGGQAATSSVRGTAARTLW